jgi:hypothetical protein
MPATSAHTVGGRWPELGRLIAYSLVIVVGAAYFSSYFVIGVLSRHLLLFSLILVPSLALTFRLFLLGWFHWYVYVLAVVLDGSAGLALATYSRHFGTNASVHVIRSDFNEGTLVVKIRLSDKPLFALVITNTSHVPFDFVTHEVFPGRGLLTRYFNAINYTDAGLEEFFSSLPGCYVVVVYGDHSAAVEDQSYTSRDHDGVGYVPGFVSILEDGRFSRPRCSGWPPAPYPHPDLRSLHRLVRESFSTSERQTHR